MGYLKEDVDVVVDKLKAEAIVRAKNVVEHRGRAPRLTIIAVGDDPASAVYVKGKTKICREAGVDVEVVRPEATTEAVTELIATLNADVSVDAILLQLPLPDHLDEDELTALIAPAKDVDGLTAVNVGNRWLGGDGGVTPCTPAGILKFINFKLADNAFNSLSGKIVVIVGRSNLVGKPLAAELLRRNATPVLAHSRTSRVKLNQLLAIADVVVVAVGKPGVIDETSWIAPGTLVVDVGINRIDGKLYGDVSPEVAVDADVTPVPGGVGRLTTASLVVNVCKLAQNDVNV